MAVVIKHSHEKHVCAYRISKLLNKKDGILSIATLEMEVFDNLDAA